MKKILTILLAVAMIFTFIACDQPTGGKDPVNNSGSENNQSNQDPFVAIQSTLTEKVESPDEINWDGTWDFVNTVIEIEDDLGTYTSTITGFFIAKGNNLTQTITSCIETYQFEHEEDYLYYKAEIEADPEDGYYESADFNNEKLTIVTKAKIDESKSTEDFPLEELFDTFSGCEIKTNSAKTAVKVSFSEEDYCGSIILIKR